MKCHINLNAKSWFVIMWANGYNCRLFGCKFYFMNTYDNNFRMYFKNRMGVPPKCFIF